MAEIYECNVCHVLTGRHVPACPVCHHGGLTKIGNVTSSPEVKGADSESL